MNRSVIADSAIEDRYHIFSSGEGSDSKWGYMIYDQNNIQCFGSKDLMPEADPSILSIPGFYEKVRHLKRFDPAHCPILEIQTVGDCHYLLQYYRTRNFLKSPFNLEREPENGEMQAVFVRGATPKEGLRLKVNIHKYASARKLPQEEEAGIDMHFITIFSQIMTRRRKLLIEKDNDMVGISLRAANHLSLALLFKPEVTIFVAEKDFESIINDTIASLPEGSLPPYQTTVDVVSDGRKAYLKYLPS